MSVRGGREDDSHLRGSSLLVVGRLFALTLDLLSQILVVRYLTKDEFGGFAFALAVVSIGSSLAAFGLDKTIGRFLPVYEERGERGKVLGALALAFGTMTTIGIGTIVVVHGVVALGADFGDPTTSILLILIVLVPIQAIQPLFTAIFAAFSNARAIFFRNHILAPTVQLAVVSALIIGGGGLSWLAVGWVAAGFAGIAFSAPLLHRMLRTRGYLAGDPHLHVQYPTRELFSFSMPLLSSDFVLVLRGALVPVLLALWGSTVDVADFRAVLPHARLNLVVFQSFAFLFLPAAARLATRRDGVAMQELYWQSAVWVALATFPILAVTLAFAPALVDFLYGERYADSAAIMAVLALGFFVSSALSFAGLALRALGRVRYLFIVDIGTALLSLTAYAFAIPAWGALGAAAVTAGTLMAQVALYQFGLQRAIGGSLFERRYTGVYGSIVLAMIGLVLTQVVVSPPLWLAVAVGGGVSLILLRVHRGSVALLQTFPEIRRVPLLARFLE